MIDMAVIHLILCGFFVILVCSVPTVHSQCVGIPSRRTATFAWNYIKSPNYPLFTTGPADCSWIIDGGSYGVVLSPDVFSLPLSTLCLQSNVEVYDGIDSSSRRLGRFCGLSMSTVYSSGRYLYVKYTAATNTQSRIKLRYDQYSSSSRTIYISSGVVGVCVFIALVIVCVVVRRRRNRHCHYDHC